MVPSPSPSPPLYLACDVGTGSVRAALFTQNGCKQTATHIHPTKTRNAQPDHYEQSSADIWSAVVSTTRAACRDAGPDAAARVKAIAFDATCSLVAVDADTAEPLSVVETAPDAGAAAAGRGKEPVQNNLVYDVCLWCDHRSIPEADAINAAEGKDVVAVRRHFGGKLSAENEPPKLAHLAKHMPEFRKAAFFDLADWLTFKCIGGATEDSPRSSCTVACKWGWGPLSGPAWNPAFWRDIGLSELVSEDGTNVSPRIGRRVVPPGFCVGTLSAASAVELGLTSAVRVAAPMIDAHCGALAMLSPSGLALEAAAPRLCNRLAMICGTSTCHLAVTDEPMFVPGVWGPFRDAVLPGMWCAEGGQSATGALIDDILHRASASVSLRQLAEAEGKSLYMVLEELSRNLDTNECHVLPYFHGNRSPRADPTLRGVITGISLAPGQQAEQELARLFKAALQSLALGARHIIRELNSNGHQLSAIVACGGLAKSNLFMQTLASACKMPVFTTVEEDSVLSGGAILAACAARGEDRGLDEPLLRQMSTVSERKFLPEEASADFFDKKFQVFLAMHEHTMFYRKIMGNENVAT